MMRTIYTETTIYQVIRNINDLRGRRDFRIFAIRGFGNCYGFKEGQDMGEYINSVTACKIEIKV